MTSSDEECLNELLRANTFWDAESGETDNLRRLLKLCSALPAFKTLDRHDQIQLIKGIVVRTKFIF